jgi:hypothetical protein
MPLIDVDRRFPDIDQATFTMQPVRHRSAVIQGRLTQMP